ncbi:MAG: ATP-binding protein [Desulfobacterales bacterium]|nr:ATP-binding protein [Desulfobacterales bacterium]
MKSTMDTCKKIPYGFSNFKKIKQENYYYVDKSRYIPELEAADKFLFLIRPRRFGKSSLLSVLECYYDIARKDEFDLLFKDSYIKKNPTPEKNSHLILKFNFSRVSPEPENVEASFNGHVQNSFFIFEKKYRAFLDDDYFEFMPTRQGVHQKLEFLLDYLGLKDLKVYILIDEYDNFTNTILSTIGHEKYTSLTHGTGFFRFFFNVLKGAVHQVDSGVSRMFITGVSPVTMDDVTSGFNIGSNISLDPRFNAMIGFTEQDVVEILDYYRGFGMPLPDADETLKLMKAWYGHYRFSKKVDVELFNTNMVLYFVKSLFQNGEYPEELIDQNVKIDYDKLRHLVVLDKRLNGNFSRLTEILEKGAVTSKIVNSFPVDRLTKPINFISLLFYFGLLSYSKSHELTIPNQTVRSLMYEYIREGYEDVEVFSVDLWRFANLIRDMAYRGEWEAVFVFLADEVKRQTSIRDYLTGEKVIQTFLLAYLNVTDYFIATTEEEMGKGFVDLYLEPFLAKHPDVKYAWLIELKYMKRGDFSEKKAQKLLGEAKDQLARYARDQRIINRCGGAALKRIALVFHGWELKVLKDCGQGVSDGESEW